MGKLDMLWKMVPVHRNQRMWVQLFKQTLKVEHRGHGSFRRCDRQFHTPACLGHWAAKLFGAFLRCFWMHSGKTKESRLLCLTWVSCIQPSEDKKKKNHRKSNRFSSNSQNFALTELIWSLSRHQTKVKISFWVSSLSTFRLELMPWTLLVPQLIGGYHLKSLGHPNLCDHIAQYLPHHLSNIDGNKVLYSC